MKIEEYAYNALLNYGAISENWRVKVLKVEIKGYSNWADVEVEIYRPRSRKPDYAWTLKMNTVFNFTDFSKSKFYDLKK